MIDVLRFDLREMENIFKKKTFYRWVAKSEFTVIKFLSEH
jgi:hypothetical protein